MSKNPLAKQGTNGPMAVFRAALASAQKSFEDALPATVGRVLTPERLTKIALAAIGRSEQLLQCTPTSILRAVMDAASLGLDPSGGARGHAYLVPYRNRKMGGQYEAQLIVGYRGYIELGRRSGKLTAVQAELVHERDEFTYRKGDDPKIYHQPALDGDPGIIRGAYCIASLVDGEPRREYLQREYMAIAQIEQIRDSSAAGKYGPWQTHYGEMVRKTVLRRAAKWWPLSPELARAFDIEDRAEDPPLADTEDVAEIPPAGPVPGRYDFRTEKRRRKPAPAKRGPEPEPEPDSEPESLSGPPEAPEPPTQSDGPPPPEDDDMPAWTDDDMPAWTDDGG